MEENTRRPLRRRTFLVGLGAAAAGTGAVTVVASAGWTDPGFFPLAVFSGRPAHAEQLKDIGINTFQAVEHNDPLSVATSKGIFCIVQDEFTAAEIGDDPKAVGLFAYDECDIGLGCEGTDTDTNLANMRKQVAELRSRQDDRFINANYSKGVLETWWARETMDDFMAVVDVASVDNYAYTSPDTGEAVRLSPHWPGHAGVAFCHLRVARGPHALLPVPGGHQAELDVRGDRHAIPE